MCVCVFVPFEHDLDLWEGTVVVIVVVAVAVVAVAAFKLCASVLESVSF